MPLEHVTKRLVQVSSQDFAGKNLIRGRGTKTNQTQKEAGVICTSQNSHSQDPESTYTTGGTVGQYLSVHALKNVLGSSDSENILVYLRKKK